jgi:hypothetical protein
VRRHHTIGILTAGVAVLALSCTGSSDTDGPTRPNPTATTVRFAGVDFDVGCTPVAEALVDIELPHRGRPKLRAVTGLWDHQAIAVLANDPRGCGVWTLALAAGLSEATRSAIERETARGVEIFGVTASPVPRNEGP